MDAAQLPSPQIGRILIAAGLLTEVQLAEALEEQHQTGRRLGEIIVRRGFISGPALANALAEQHGGLLKTEYGFATGLGGDVAQKAAAEAVSDAPMPMLRTADPAPVTPLRPPAPEPEPEPVVEEPVPLELRAGAEAVREALRATIVVGRSATRPRSRGRERPGSSRRGRRIPPRGWRRRRVAATTTG